MTNQFSKILLTLSIILLLWVTLSQPAAAQKYAITDIGTLGGSQSFTYAINDVGQVVGYSWMAGDASGHPFLYRKGKMTDLYPLMGATTPQSINNLGQIASGVVVSGIYSPAVFDSRTNTITILGSLGGFTSYGFNGVANSINNIGQAVGYSYIDNINRHAFLYENGAMSDIGSFGGYSSALAINDSGMIVGFASDTYNGRAHAFLYTNGVMTDIDPFGDSDFSWSESYARDINNHGQVVGEFLTEDETAFHCFLYDRGRITDIGTLGGPDCTADAINERGDVVGTSPVQVGTEVYCDPETGTCYEYPIYSWHAFLYKNGKMTDLNTLIPSDSGWELNWAFDINNKGQVVGYGTVDDRFRAFLLTPIPSKK